MTQMRTPKQSFLMTPGPVTISETVSAALAKPVLFHRYSEFQSLFLKTCNKLCNVFDAPESYKIFFSPDQALLRMRRRFRQYLTLTIRC